MMRRNLAIEALEGRCMLSVTQLFESSSTGFEDESGRVGDTSTAIELASQAKPLSSSNQSNDAGLSGFGGLTVSQVRAQRSAIAQIGKLGLRLHEFGLFENWGELCYPPVEQSPHES